MRKIVVNIFWIYALATLGVSFSGFFGVQVPPIVTVLLTALGFTFALLHGAVTIGWRNSLLFVLFTFVISLVFESIGVATGLIYGPYHYTDKLGPLFLGLVPYLIPLAWFMMMYPSWLIAERIVPAGWPGWQRKLAVAALGGLAMTAWDLAMDPFMVKIGHWVWETDGAYFGIPLQNYWGWWLTSFVTLAGFVFLAKPEANLRVNRIGNPQDFFHFERLAIYTYAINGLSSILTDVNVNLGGPALVGLFAMLPWVVIAIRSD
jgi:uncharacterized membrane protein